MPGRWKKKRREEVKLKVRRRWRRRRLRRKSVRKVQLRKSRPVS